MTTKSEQLLKIKAKIVSLLEINEQLLSENKRLLEENNKLKKDGSLIEAKLLKFEQTDVTNQSREIESEAKEKEKIRQQLTQHIEDIDQCVNWLKKMD